MKTKLALLIAAARRPLDQLIADRRGMSSIEFAMLLPVMIILYIGGVEITSAIAIDRKVSQVARTLGDLVAQATNITATDMSSIMGATSSIVQPYDDTKLKITVSSVQVDAQGHAKVSWSDTKNGTVRQVGSAVTLPAGLSVANTSVILAESQYAYTPGLGYVITGTMNLGDQIFMRPRMSSCVLRVGAQTAC